MDERILRKAALALRQARLAATSVSFSQEVGDVNMVYARAVIDAVLPDLLAAQAGTAGRANGGKADRDTLRMPPG